MQTFGERLAAARKAKGMTQEALSQAAAVTRQTISSWERGRTIPDIDTVRRLSAILDCDLIQSAEVQSAAPVVEETPTEGEQTTPAAGKRQIKRWWIVAGVAALVCAILISSLLFPRKSAPAGGRDAFDAETYQQKTPNEAGKAYLTIDSRTWDEKGDNDVYQRYDIALNEYNGIGFTMTRLELEMEGKTGIIRTRKYGTKDMLASQINPDIVPYGNLTIDGGFPKGEFKRMGIAVYGNDANGAPLTFYHLTEF